jgi:hypothetical protein
MKTGRFTSCCISANAVFTTFRTVSQSGLYAGSGWHMRGGRSPEGPLHSPGWRESCSFSKAGPFGNRDCHGIWVCSRSITQWCECSAFFDSRFAR